MILKLMSEMLPRKLPTTELSSFEYGVIAGQQMMYDTIQERLKVIPINTIEEK